MRHHLSCPDYNFTLGKKKHSENGQQELVLVSKLRSITLKNVEWCQAKQETNTLDNTHSKFTLSSIIWEVEKGPLETENGQKLLNLSSHWSSSKNYTKTKSWEKETKGNYHHYLLPAKRQALQHHTPSCRSYIGLEVSIRHMQRACLKQKKGCSDNSTQDRSARPCSLLA